MTIIVQYNASPNMTHKDKDGIIRDLNTWESQGNNSNHIVGAVNCSSLDLQQCKQATKVFKCSAICKLTQCYKQHDETSAN